MARRDETRLDFIRAELRSCDLAVVDGVNSGGRLTISAFAAAIRQGTPSHKYVAGQNTDYFLSHGSYWLVLTYDRGKNMPMGAAWLTMT